MYCTSFNSWQETDHFQHRSLHLRVALSVLEEAAGAAEDIEQMLNKILPLRENDLFLPRRHGTDMLLDRSRETIRTQTLALQSLMDQARKVMLIKRNTCLWSNKDFFGIIMKNDSYFIFLYLKVRHLLCNITKIKLVKDNRSDSPYVF